MHVPFIIPPKYLWFQSGQSDSALAWLLGAFLLVAVIFLIAWLAARRRKAKEEQLEEIAASQIGSPISGAIPSTGAETTTPGEAAVIASQVISVPPDEIVEEVERRQIGDDLTRIEGIGPVLQEILHTAGIFTYEKLAQSSPTLLKDMLINSDLEYIDPTHWPEQGRLASEGRWDELEAYQRRLRGEEI